MWTTNATEVGLPEPIALNPEGGFWQAGPEGHPVFRARTPGGDYLPPVSKGTEDIWAVEVPGTILNPWDADFSKVFYTKEELAYDTLTAEIERYNDAAAEVGRLLFGKEEIT